MTITQQQAIEALERVYYATHASFIDRNLVRQYIEQSTAQPQAVVPADQRPVNCGTGYCSCIECVVEPTAQAERAPVVQAVQAREYPPLPWGNQQPYVWFCRTKDTDLVAAFRAYVDADRASSGATTPTAPFAKDSWQQAVDNQLVAFGRTSQEFANPHEALAWLAIMNMELGQSNAGATTQAVRFMTSDDCQEHIGRTWLTHEEDAAIAAFCAVNAGKRIPAEGVIGGV